MKKLITLLFCCLPLHFVQAEEGCAQHLSPEEFRAKQEAFITERAELTPEEAARFFPIYFELQAAKRKLNEEAFKLMRKGDNKATTDEQYTQILTGVFDRRLAISRLDKEYFEKFKKVLPLRKIYLVQRAEIRFSREVIKGMHKKGSPPARPKK
ncbi:MAG: hypothetical protein LBM06_08780 [Prevotellaceae bacterium]|jgi:hypothetical protein|nr:hypothetical protein [Prevotellaceae bacterium]